MTTDSADPVSVLAPLGTAIRRLTEGGAGHDQLLYFTSSSLLADDRQLVVISERDGHPNLLLRDLAHGTERQLTHNTDGVLKSYVYFNGQAYRGFGKASVSLHAASGTVYYIQGREIRYVDADGRARTLAEYPAGQMTAFTHVSSDGTRLCVPTVDARALDDLRPLGMPRPDYDIDERVRREHLSSWLRVYDTRTGAEVCCERVPEAWITHVQFSPRDRDLILYNHEWPSDCGIRRVWLWDGRSHRRLRDEGPGRGRADWTCHEMWERDGAAILYHGNYQDGRNYVGRVRADGSERVEIPLPAPWRRYGHFTEGPPGLLVTDGCFETEGDDAVAIRGHTPGGAWISVLHVDWVRGLIRWQPLCRHGSSWKSQDEHPHPIFNHAGNAILFVSDRDGARGVYAVPVPTRL